MFGTQQSVLNTDVSFYQGYLLRGVLYKHFGFSNRITLDISRFRVFFLLDRQMTDGRSKWVNPTIYTWGNKSEL